MNKSDFIIISGTNDAILRNEVDKGNNFDNMHRAVYERTINNVNLIVPSAKKFMNYFLNVRDAAEGKVGLFTLDNNLVPKDEVEELWNRLSSGYKGGCWTYLSDGFVQGFSNRVGLYHLSDFSLFNGRGGQILKPAKINFLEECIMKDCFVDLIFDNQGLATTMSSEQSYRQGENIKFFYPRKDSVARFYAGSDRANFGCHRDPGYSDPALGVFGYAEGVAQKN